MPWTPSTVGTSGRRRGQSVLPPYAALAWRWWRVVGSHVPGDLDAPVLRTQTLQSRAAYERLSTTGLLSGAADQDAEDSFREPYLWMRKQMHRRLGSSGEGMVWLWARITRRDLSEVCRHARGDVLLTVDVPRDRVLLSDFSEWHSVLNCLPAVPRTDGESDEAWTQRTGYVVERWLARTERYLQSPLADWPTALREELETSWSTVLDMWAVESGTIQGVVHELRARDVVRAERIC